METKQFEKITSRRILLVAMMTGFAVVLFFTLTPWNVIPTQVTEEVTVLAVTEDGCVGESQYGISVVVPDCSAQVGDVVSATFYVPSMEINGYLEDLDKRQNPMVDAWDRDVSGSGIAP